MRCTGKALSFCMMVKNEERELPGCLDSVRDLAGELIVVDTGSTDATRMIAADYGAKIIPFDFSRVDFAAARNRGIAEATGRWILVLDADERLDRAGGDQVAQLTERNENAGYFLERHNRTPDSADVVKDHVVRLFPRHERYRYRGRVHETIDQSILANGGRLFETGIRVEHNFVADREGRRRKNHWYIEILKEEIRENPADSTRLDFLAAEYHQLEHYAEAAAVMEEIVRARPKDARARLFLGTYYWLYQRDAQKARGEFQRALELKPGYADAMAFLRDIEKHERIK